MLRLNQGHLIATIVFGFIAIVLIANSEKFSYALDYELNVLTKDCTYTKYVQDKSECIKPEYTESHIAR